MTSIIIPVYNNFQYTQLAVESIKKYTKDCELIIVDNGSTDETEILRNNFGMIFVKNEKNLGFPKACNIGASKASGEFILFLNNDVVVTPNWLENMLKHYKYFPNLGIVGCKTNYISGLQKEGDFDFQIDFPNKEVFINKKAEQVARENFNKIRIFPRITGFCMLMKRDLFIEINGFDERYGLGNFEDDDICVKSENSGKKNAIIDETWIYHFGSKTFGLLSKGTEARDDLCLENEKKFMEKWGFENVNWWEEYL
jgi:GT2 family glycosyltransferase